MLQCRLTTEKHSTGTLLAKLNACLSLVQRWDGPQWATVAESDDSMPSEATTSVPHAKLLAALRTARAYPRAVAAGVTEGGPIVLKETHISWVFLVGAYAFKIKKPILTPFLDYRLLGSRKDFCGREVALNQRYSDQLYIGVVPISLRDGAVVVEAEGKAIEYAVKMHRFNEDALLSTRLAGGRLTGQEIKSIGVMLADFHTRAQPVSRADVALRDPQRFGDEAFANFTSLASLTGPPVAEKLRLLSDWTARFFSEHRQQFRSRIEHGFVRECHGDLHANNMVQWKGRWQPFDGIEFNEAFRFIDNLSDIAFLAMDLHARHAPQFAAVLLNSYLEQTGDYRSLSLLRWYLVYRALVRAKVALLRSQQLSGECAVSELTDVRQHIDLAAQFAFPAAPKLWIMHGLSGSGKSTASEQLVNRHGAIRIRSDLQRKRTPVNSAQPAESPYSPAARARVYHELRQLAERILLAGFPVVIDATFLQANQRSEFRSLAQQLQLPMNIVHCEAPLEVLQQRIRQRASQTENVSEADLLVLQQQLEQQDALTAEEWRWTVIVDDGV